MGRMVNVVGDKSTGKTLLAIEAMVNFIQEYPEGKIRYNETEAAFDDSYAAALGLDLKQVSRAESDTVESFFHDLTAFIAQVGSKSHGLYIVDSLDALSDKAEMGRGIEESTYGASKPKQLGQLFRRLIKPLEKSNVCVIIISQVRDAIGVTFGNKHTRSGGKALDFYASQIVWLANIGQNKKTVNKIQRTVGVNIKAKTSKNKIGQPFRECEFEILFGYGIDDVASGLQFLKEAGSLDLIEDLISGTSDAALAGFKKRFKQAPHKEQRTIRKDLNQAVRKAWYLIERSFAPKQGKYASTKESDDD